MDQQAIKELIKVLKDFSTFWKEGVSFLQGVPKLFSTFEAWDADRRGDKEIISNTRKAFSIKTK